MQSLTLAKTGQISPELLSSDTLINTIKYISNERGRKELPIDLINGNYFEYLEISEVNIVTKNFKFIYIVKVPLVELNNYKAFRVIPAPKIINDNIAIYMSNPYDYVITNDEKLLYTPGDQQFLDNCKVHKTTHFCKTIHPKYSIQTEKECINEIINEPFSLDSNDCDLKLVKIKHTLWIQFHSNNKWLYAAPKPEKLKIICNDEIIEDKIINGTNVIYIKPGCSAITKNVILNSYTEKTYDQTQAFIPITTHNFSIHFDLLTDISLNTSLHKIHTLESAHTEIEDLTKYGVQLQNIRNEAIDIGNHVRTKTFYEKFVSWITYALYIIGGLIILYIAYKMKIFTLLKFLITGIINCIKNLSDCYFSIFKNKSNSKQTNDIRLETINNPEINIQPTSSKTVKISPSKKSKPYRSQLQLSEFEV